MFVVVVGVALSGIPLPSEPTLFPPDTHKVFEVGSNVTFCCLLPPGGEFSGMTLKGKPKATVKIHDQAYAMTVHLRRPSGFNGNDVTCNTPDFGTTFYVGCKSAAPLRIRLIWFLDLVHGCAPSQFSP